MYNYPLWASKPTFARIDFLRSNGLLMKKKLVIMLKNALKIRQVLVGELTSSYPCFDTNSGHI